MWIGESGCGVVVDMVDVVEEKGLDGRQKSFDGDGILLPRQSTDEKDREGEWREQGLSFSKTLVERRRNSLREDIVARWLREIGRASCRERVF